MHVTKFTVTINAIVLNGLQFHRELPRVKGYGRVHASCSAVADHGISCPTNISLKLVGYLDLMS